MPGLLVGDLGAIIEFQVLRIGARRASAGAMLEQQEEKMSEQKSAYERSADLPAKLECQSNGLWSPDDAVAKAIADLVEAHNTMMLSTNCSGFFVDEPPPIGVARARRAEAAIKVMQALLVEGLEALDPPSD